MKINGKTYDTPNREEIIIPRGNDEPIVFVAEAVLDFEEFDKLCPVPLPPIIKRPNGDESQDVNDKAYLEKVQKHSLQRMAWMCIKSLEATEGLEWETVDKSNPETWENFRKELKDAMFSEVEQNMIIFGVLSANSLDEEKIEAARKSFLAGREAVAKTS